MGKVSYTFFKTDKIYKPFQIEEQPRIIYVNMEKVVSASGSFLVAPRQNTRLK